MRTQLVDGLFADMLQVVRLLRMYCGAGGRGMAWSANICRPEMKAGQQI